MEGVYDYLKEKGWNLQQVQAFIPTPMTLATAMYWTGLNPMSMKPLFVAKDWKDRKIQQALLQRHKPEHKEIIKEYEREKRKAAATNGAHVPPGRQQASAPSEKNPHQQKNRAERSRSIVDVPKKKLGPKLFLDSR